MKRLKSASLILLFTCGMATNALSNGRFFMPVMAWVFPGLLLTFSRRMTPGKGYLCIAAGLSVAHQFSFWGFASQDSGQALFYLPMLLGPLFALPYLADRLLRRRLAGFSSSLVFPACYVGIEFLYAQNPLGSTGVLGYTQYRSLELAQLSSLTGVLGLTFMITWTGSAIAWLLEAYQEGRSLRKPLLGLVLVWSCVLLFGSARLQLPHDVPTVTVTGLHVHDLRGEEGRRLMRLASEDPDAFDAESRALTQRLWEASRRQAAAGAKIIVWSEVSPMLSERILSEFKEQAAAFAQEEGVYLATAPYVFHDAELDENKLLLHSPAGREVLRHVKYGGNLLEGSKPGDGIIRHVDTEHGRLAGVVCWDQDFPAIMRQVGRSDVDILLVPNADWPEITPLHSAVGYFRAVENGVSLVRQNNQGLSLIVDPKGRILAQMDHARSDVWVMTAQVPTRGVWTLYASAGDWLVVAAAVFLLLQLSRYQMRRKRNP